LGELTVSTPIVSFFLSALQNESSTYGFVFFETEQGMLKSVGSKRNYLITLPTIASPLQDVSSCLPTATPLYWVSFTVGDRRRDELKRE